MHGYDGVEQSCHQQLLAKRTGLALTELVKRIHHGIWAVQFPST